MHIDSLGIQLSGAVQVRRGSAGAPLIDQRDVIDGLRDLVVGCGWSATGIKASGTILYPFGFPTVSGVQTTFPKMVVGCGGTFVYLDGVNYVYYDPWNETPDPAATCVFFALDTTITGGLTNLVAALSRSRYSAAWSSGPWQVTVTAAGFGASYNYPTFNGDGRWGDSSDISGGGWTLTSVEDRDSGGALRTARYSVTVTSVGGINRASSHFTRPVWFDFQTDYNGAGTAVFPIDTWLDPSLPDGPGTKFGGAGYVMVANPYSFAIFCPDAVATGIWACAPYIPTEEDFAAAYALFVVGPFFNPYSNGAWWGGGYAVAIDAGLSQADYSGTPGFPRMLAMRSPGATPLVTPSGSALITNAWVMFGRNVSSTPYVVGKLWDCAMVSDVVPSVGTLIAGNRYLPLGVQDGSGGWTRTSLVFRVG